MKISELNENEYASYFNKYIKLSGSETILLDELEICLHDFIRFVQNIPLDKFDYRYEVNKWTIKEIIQHLIDTERIFQYRALRISRNDATPLPGFDENDYAKNSNGNSRSIQDLLTEMAVVRQSTLSLFKSFSQDQLLLIGTASENKISVRAIGFIMIGHQKHHQQIFEERYL